MSKTVKRYIYILIVLSICVIVELILARKLGL